MDQMLGLDRTSPPHHGALPDTAVQVSCSSTSQRITGTTHTGRKCTDSESLHSKDALNIFMTSIKKMG